MEAVWVDVGDARRGATAPHDIGYAVRRHRPSETEPELRPILVAVTRPGPEVSIERLRRSPSERTRPLPPALAQHEGNVLLEIDVCEPEPGQFGQAHACVEEQPNDRHVSAILERAALARGKQAADLVVGVDIGRRFGHVRWAHRRHRTCLELALGDGPAEERLERSVANGRRRRLESRQLVGDEVQAECLSDAVHGGRETFRSQERFECRDRVEVRRHGLRTLVFGQKRPPEAVGEDAECRSGRRIGGLWGHLEPSETCPVRVSESIVPAQRIVEPLS